MAEVFTTQTVCKRRPECCQPRKIQLVAIDADDTLWKIEPFGIASSIKGPCKLIDPDTLECEEDHYKAPPTKPKHKVSIPSLPELGEMETDEEEIERWWQAKIAPEEKGKSKLTDQQEAKLKELSSEHGGTKRTVYPERKGDVALVIFNDGTAFDIFPSGLVVKSTLSKPVKSVEEISEELIESLPEKNKKMLKSMTKITGKEEKLLKLPSPKPKPEAKRKEKEEVSEEELRRQTMEGLEEEAISKGRGRKVTIKLLPTTRQTLDELQKRKIPAAVISLNTPGTVKRLIDAFGLSDKFVEVQDTWDNKGKIFDEITQRQKICPCNALFVDNLASHVDEVTKKCGLGLVLGKGQDIESLSEILDFIEEKHGGS